MFQFRLKIASAFFDNLACEQAHLFGWGASTKSWREEWGEGIQKSIARKEKQRQAYTGSQCGFCGCVALSEPSNYSFALTSMSFRDLPLL